MLSLSTAFDRGTGLLLYNTETKEFDKEQTVDGKSTASFSANTDNATVPTGPLSKVTSFAYEILTGYQDLFM